MSLTDTTALAAAALEVLDVEADLTSVRALRGSVAPLESQLQAAQTAYEMEVQARTPGAVGALSPAS